MNFKDPEFFYSQEADKPLTLTIWHPINKKWIHIVQIFKKNGITQYYTDGKLEHVDNESNLKGQI